MPIHLEMPHAVEKLRLLLANPFDPLEKDLRIAGWSSYMLMGLSSPGILATWLPGEADENAFMTRIRSAFTLPVEDFASPGIPKFEEFWLKYCLNHHGDRYGIEVLADLDKTGRRTQGDLLVRLRDGRTVCLELETEDRNFLRHGHPADGRVCFTVPPKQVDLPVETLYADADHFSAWFRRVLERREAGTLLYMVLYGHARMILGSFPATQPDANEDMRWLERQLRRAALDLVFPVFKHSDWELIDLPAARTLLETRLSQAPQRDHCDDCGSPLHLFWEARVVGPEPDHDQVTEGQLADYFMELASSGGSNWTLTLQWYWCPTCRECAFLSEED